MEYDLFIGSKLGRLNAAERLYEVARNVIGKGVKFEKIRHQLGFQYVCIDCEYFSIDIDLDDEDHDMQEYQEMNIRYHGVNTDVRISVELISKTFNIGWVKFLELMGKLLRSMDGDLLLLDDTSFPVMKKNDILYVNSNVDEYRAKYINKKNLNRLHCPFIEENFSIKL